MVESVCMLCTNSGHLWQSRAEPEDGRHKRHNGGSPFDDVIMTFAEIVIQRTHSIKL